jgi:hypothetical protein
MRRQEKLGYSLYTRISLCYGEQTIISGVRKQNGKHESAKGLIHGIFTTRHMSP